MLSAVLRSHWVRAGIVRVVRDGTGGAFGAFVGALQVSVCAGGTARRGRTDPYVPCKKIFKLRVV